ncbi:MAG: GNAT family N-acetyltransferase [Phycisphaerae bacterium]|nr:GNAT family N-acetyltransferase [Phycisphaerae bacterium]
MSEASTARAWVEAVELHDAELTPTVRLVPLERRHAGELFALADPELFRHSMQNPPEWSVHGFELEMEKVKATPGVVAFAIVLARGEGGVEAGRAIGRTTYMDIRPEHRGLEIGRTWIARRFHGSRVNPEIKFLMLRQAFEALTPTALRVQITTGGTNLHSQRAIEKLGAVREGVLRDARLMPPLPAMPDGSRLAGREETVVRDWVFYSVLAREWSAPGGVRDRLIARLKG